jgi:hypothetical protein
MIVRCTHCGKSSRVAAEGFFRCPHCRQIFQAKAADWVAEPRAGVAPSLVYDDEPAPTEPLGEGTPAAEPPSPTSAPPLCERCGNYQATTVCRECGLLVCTACAEPSGPGQALCRAHLREAERSSPENRPFSLLVNLLSRPAATIAQILPDARLFGRALTFYLLTGMFGVICREVYAAALPEPFGDPTAALFAYAFPFLQSEPSTTATIMSIVVAPLGLLAALFLQGLFFHAAFRLTGAGKGGLTVTCKALAYAAGASSVLFALPVIGAFLSAAYGIVLTVIGAAKLHRSSYGRVLLSILLLIFLAALIGAVAMNLLPGAGDVVKGAGKLI